MAQLLKHAEVETKESATETEENKKEKEEKEDNEETKEEGEGGRKATETNGDASNEETKEFSQERACSTSDWKDHEVPNKGNHSEHASSSPDNKTNKSKNGGSRKTNSKPPPQQQKLAASTKAEQGTNKADKAAKGGKSETTTDKVAPSKETNSNKADGNGHKPTGKSTDDRVIKSTKGKAKEKTSKDGGAQKKTGDNKKGKAAENDDAEQEKEEKPFNADEDAEKLHDAMKGFGTDEKSLIEVISARDAAQRQEIRQSYLDQYENDVMTELDSELSGDFGDMLQDLMRLPWERELQALVDSMAGVGTKEMLLLHVLLTHDALSAEVLCKKYKEAQKKELTKAVDSETSGHLRRLLQTILKVQLKKQKPDTRSPEEVAKKLYNGGKPLLQSKPGDAVDILATFPAEKMTEMASSYEQISGHSLQDDIQKHLSCDAEKALLPLVSHCCDPEAYEIDVFHRSLEGELTFRIFSLIFCSKEDNLQDLQQRYEAATGSSLRSVVEKELKGDTRTLVLHALARAA